MRYRFYNTTYVIFAAATILVYLGQAPSQVDIEPHLRLVSMAIEVLDTMADESIVASKSAKLLQKAMEREASLRQDKTSERLAVTLMSMTGSSTAASTASGSDEAGGVAADPMCGPEWRHPWAPVNMLDNDMMGFDFGLPLVDLEGRDGLPGTE